VQRVSPVQAIEIARRHYGISGTAERLASEHDDTFRLVAADGAARLLKINVVQTGRALTGRAADGGENAPGEVSFQSAVLLHLAEVAPELPVQRVVTTLDGRAEIVLGAPSRIVRMTSWLDGELLGRAATSAALRRDIGTTLARLNLALRRFSHPDARRTHPWDLQNFLRLRPLLDELQEGDQWLADGLWVAIERCLDRFDAVVRPRLADTATQVIHADFHGENLLTDGGRVTGILDFGDALAGPVAMDVGIAACYQLGACGHAGAGDDDLLLPAIDVVAGYQAVDPLGGTDLDLVSEFIVARVAARIIVSQANAARDPANRRYLLRRTPQAIAHFDALRQLPRDELASRLRHRCLDGRIGS